MKAHNAAAPAANLSQEATVPLKDIAVFNTICMTTDSVAAEQQRKLAISSGRAAVPYCAKATWSLGSNKIPVHS